LEIYKQLSKIYSSMKQMSRMKKVYQTKFPNSLLKKKSPCSSKLKISEKNIPKLRVMMWRSIKIKLLKIFSSISIVNYKLRLKKNINAVPKNWWSIQVSRNIIKKSPIANRINWLRSNKLSKATSNSYSQTYLKILNWKQNNLLHKQSQ
jgi:hypothetical protein